MRTASKTQLPQAGPLGSTPPPGDREPLFAGPLFELVAVGLCRASLDALCDSAAATAIDPGTLRRTTASVDRSYLVRILEEEIGRQFGHPLRPIVELVLNAVDAERNESGPRVVDVTVTHGLVSVLDGGEGMSLRSILSKLLVPFATDKRPGADIGRFGVGFFSVLGFGLMAPDGFGIHVETGTGSEAWSIRVVSNGFDVPSLDCSVRAAAPRRGTSVTVTSPLLDTDSMRMYLRDALHFFPPERAIIRLDGAVMNDGSVIAGGQRYDELAKAGPPPVTARFQIGGRGLAPGIVAATYHAGVKVETCLAIPELTLIDFPSEVELTEGRDALKPGPAFAAVAIAFYRRLARVGAAPGVTDATRRRFAELAGQISALMLQSAGWSEAAHELAHALLGPGRFLVSADRADAVIGFLGPDIADRLFVPESFWAERHWVGQIPGERELLERELEIGPTETLDGLARRRRDLDGLAVLASRTTEPASVAVALARRRVPRPAHRGIMPCLGTRRGILLREDAPALRNAGGWLELYALRASFDRASGLREADVERNLIVRDPMAFGG